LKIRAGVPRSQKPRAKPVKLPTAATPLAPGLEGRAVKAQRTKLAALATDAAVRMVAAGSANSTAVAGPSPLERFGEVLGEGLGVIVTEALALVPGWNAPVLDAKGKPVKSISGATRLGAHDILKRHQEVIGPQINALVARLPAGMVHELVKGLGQGASEAPGLGYRLEAAVIDMFK
jgi:hypothetical protein